MPRFDWRDREEMHRGDDHREERDPGRREDFGQADYSNDYAYDPRRRAGFRAEEQARGDDYGQADYSKDYAFDPQQGRGYRRFSEDDRDYGRQMDQGDYARERSYEGRSYEDRDRDGRHDRDERQDGRSWMGRAGGFLSGRRDADDDQRSRRRGPSDRVLWAVISERLDDERRLDLRDVEVLVENGEVTLNGTVRHKDDKRRIEDIADIDGVRHVQNNLRVRDRGQHRGPWAII